MKAKTRAQLFAELATPSDVKWRYDPVAWAEERARVEIWSKQREILRAVVEHPRVAIHSCHSSGKGLWVETPLPTPTGWVRMGDVRVGDLLYDENGQPTRVTAVSPVRYLDCYRVTFRPGDSLICDGDHLWNILSMSQRRQLRSTKFIDVGGSRGGQVDWRQLWDNTETVEMRDLANSFTQSRRGARPGVPIAQALNTGDDVDLLIPPYVLGAWLGDGCSWNASMSNDPSDDEIIQQIQKCGWWTKRSLKSPIHVLLRVSESTPMAPLLRAYNLVKNKHIPASYLRASYAQRLELLRGLMDTDGHASKLDGNSAVDVGFKHEVLARQTYELVRSLGFPASFRTRRAKLYGKDCGDFYCVSFSSDVTPFHLTRKTARWSPMPLRLTLRSVESVEDVPTVPTRCVTVDSPRGLYLAGESMTVTHNSYTMGLLTCWWLDVYPVGEARVITTAPTSKQVDAVLWNEINRHHERLNLKGHTTKREWWIGRFLAALGRKPPDHIEAAFQGLHARHLLVLLDEAYGIPEHLWDEAESLASNENARIVVVGNPDGDGKFEQVCRPESPWHKIHISCEDTPNFTGEDVSHRLREMLVSRAWVDVRRDEWGADSALFQSKCLGIFPTVGSPWQVVPLAWANACRFLELPEPSAVDVSTEAGVDVGAGNDRTVVTIRRGSVILHVQSFVNPDPVQTVGAVALLLREWDVKTVKVDSIGVGWGIYGHLRAMSTRHTSDPLAADVVHDASVVPVNVGQGPTHGNEHRFLNRRAEMWMDIGRERSRLKQWDFSRLDGDLQNTLVHELTMPRYQIMDSRGKVQIEAKKKVIERLGKSPDVAESVLLAFVPANWTAELHTDALLAAPSLLQAVRPGDLVSTNGNGSGGPYGGYGGAGDGIYGSGWTEKRGW